MKVVPPSDAWARVAGVWREPAEESHEYPGLCLWDARVTGSITAGCSRLPLWAFVWTALRDGWAGAESGWSPSRHEWDAEKMGEFLYNLLEQRGEFGRLILVLADAERRNSGMGKAWWETKKQRRRVLKQLRRAVALLEAMESQ